MVRARSAGNRQAGCMSAAVYELAGNLRCSSTLKYRCSWCHGAMTTVNRTHGNEECGRIDVHAGQGVDDGGSAEQQHTCRIRKTLFTGRKQQCSELIHVSFNMFVLIQSREMAGDCVKGNADSPVTMMLVRKQKNRNVRCAAVPQRARTILQRSGAASECQQSALMHDSHTAGGKLVEMGYSEQRKIPTKPIRARASSTHSRMVWALGALRLTSTARMPKRMI